MKSPDQLEFIWFSKWSVGKVLYVAGRYPVVALFLLNEIYILGYGSSITLFVATGHISNNMPYARTWLLWICSFPLQSELQSSSCHYLQSNDILQATLSLRALAIWGRDWKAAVVLGVGAAIYNISVLVSYILLTIPLPYVEFSPSKLGALMKLGFISLMFYDGVMFSLILIRTVNEGRKTRAKILAILFRDGMIYYAIILGITVSSLPWSIFDKPYTALSAANLLMANSLAEFEVTLVGYLAPTVLAAQSIGASHIILNLRKYAYNNHILTSVQLSSIRYLERRTILDEFMFSQPTVPDDNELAVIERDQ
ncbi:hypothetical protein BD410DRAFT_843863 [Rickenella mellea]|uniref:Uncharacterized protein n=1 Tax=Rickenella mellea TaxID=50990 RepID=A0A4Y7PP55_9AGAM|nr:hypothetical protein BD410DRAFT_843863 [Rickenella mellea]